MDEELEDLEEIEEEEDLEELLLTEDELLRADELLTGAPGPEETEERRLDALELLEEFLPEELLLVDLEELLEERPLELEDDPPLLTWPAEDLLLLLEELEEEEFFLEDEDEEEEPPHLHTGTCFDPVPAPLHASWKLIVA